MLSAMWSQCAAQERAVERDGRIHQGSNLALRRRKGLEVQVGKAQGSDADIPAAADAEQLVRSITLTAEPRTLPAARTEASARAERFE